ncbi:MAG: PEGA domain-containing protein [Deltaproteobacteria bacterium]|nr:PEGA domain-containing protein [Deltaproteobacteria bacterium]
MKKQILKHISFIVLLSFFHVQVLWADPWSQRKSVPQKDNQEKTEEIKSKPEEQNMDLKPSDLSGIKASPTPEPAAANPVQEAKTKKEIASLKSKLPIAAVLDVYSTSLSALELREISNAFRREVKNSGRFLVYNRSEMRKALSKNLDQEIVAAKQIDEFVSQAKKLYDDFKFDSASAIMKEAMSVISAFDASPAVARKISEAYLTQGLIAEAQNKDKEAETAFLNAAALDPDRQLDPTQYSPGVIAKFYQAKEGYKKIKNGSLRIETTPTVARVFIGDKDMGSTPTTLKDLPLGVQKITLQKDGFEDWEKNVMIVANSADDYINKLALNLNKTGESVSLDALIGEVISKKDYASQISKMADVGKLLLSDKIFAARLEKSEKNYDLFVVAVDTQSGQELGRAYADIDANLSDYDVSIAHALQDLLQQKTPAQWTDLIAVEGKGSRYLASYKHQKPFYKTWPFYLILGAVVAGGGAGAAMALKGGGGGDAPPAAVPMGSASVGGLPHP